MTTSGGSETFYGSIAVFRGFARLMDPALYSPLPDGLEHRRRRYRRIDQGDRAKRVTRRSTWPALRSSLPSPMRWTGASFRSCSAVMAPALRYRRTILRRRAMRWLPAPSGSRRDLNLVMRIALVPVAAVRAQGLDVRVARFGPSPNLSYAMFSGGGLGWAEAAMKRGEFAVPKAPPGTQPDLTGLSCRFEEIPSRARPHPVGAGGPRAGRRSERLSRPARSEMIGRCRGLGLRLEQQRNAHGARALRRKIDAPPHLYLPGQCRRRPRR